MVFHGFLHRAAASALRWLTGQLPCRKTGALRLRPDRMVVATERCTEYAALSMGCIARLAFLTALGVTARWTAWPGWTARRTLRGMNYLEKKPTLDSLVRAVGSAFADVLAAQLVITRPVPTANRSCPHT